MLNNNVNRLCLGTAQFGLNYGIANNRGKIPKEEAFVILDYASKSGIDTIDTAYAYGDSEEVIGEFIRLSKSSYKIITKASSLDGKGARGIKELISGSLARLRKTKLYGCLIHTFDDFKKDPKLWDALEDVKKDGIIERIGFSLDRPDELEMILKKKVPFNIIQVPYSVFDRRFENYFQLLKDKGAELYIRSVFLQGLAFLAPDAVPVNLTEAKDYLHRMHDISDEIEVSVSGICLNFALLNHLIDKVVMGIDSLGQLKSNIADLNDMDKVGEARGRLDELILENEDIISPYRWATA